MANRPLLSGWESYEAFQKDANGEYEITPFSDALAHSGIMPTPVITKMRMVQDLGLAKRQAVYEG